MLGAIGGALSAIGSIGGMFAGSKKPPGLPPEMQMGLDWSRQLTERQMDIQELLSKEFLSAIPQIKSGYDEYRAGLQDVINQFSGSGPLAQFRANQLGKIPLYDSLESNLFSRAARAGSDAEVAAKRNMARQDAMAGIGQLVDTTRSRQMARGMGAGSGGVLSPEYLSRIGHQAGGQVYQAGEAERRYGDALQTQLYPLAASGTQRAIDNYLLPQHLMTKKAGSYAQQASTTDAASMPSNRATHGALLALQNLASSVGGVHQAQLQQFAMEQESTGGLFDAIGGLGDFIGGGAGGLGGLMKKIPGLGGLGGLLGGGSRIPSSAHSNMPLLMR